MLFVFSLIFLTDAIIIFSHNFVAPLITKTPIKAFNLKKQVLIYCDKSKSLLLKYAMQICYDKLPPIQRRTKEHLISLKVPCVVSLMKTCE